MSNQDIRETLEKQLELLSDYSEKCATCSELAALTGEMTNLAGLLLQDKQCCSSTVNVYTVNVDTEDIVRNVIGVLNKLYSNGTPPILT